HVKEASDVLEVGDIIWVKVINIDEAGKVSLSMKFVDQSKGQDLDPNNVKLELERKARASGEPIHKKVKLGTEDAVVNFTCIRCGGTGHLPTDCRITLTSSKSVAKTYDLLPDDPEADSLIEKSTHTHEKSNLDTALDVLRKAQKKSKKKKKDKDKDREKDRKKKKKHKEERERHGGEGRKRKRRGSSSESSGSD
ncbi:Nucleolar protein of 40 kDa, partial [Rhizophlyctis rosea]